MLPEVVAQRLQHLPNMIFLDSSGNLPKQGDPAVSMIAARPTEVIRGNIHNHEHAQQLRSALANWQTSETAEDSASAHTTNSDHPFPTGGACGQIDYDGAFCFGIYPEMLIYQHAQKQWWQCGDLLAAIEEPSGNPNTTSPRIHIGSFTPSMTQDEYEERIQRIHQYITAGDIYQVNLTQAYSAQTSSSSGDPAAAMFTLYEHLRRVAPAPLATWMDLNDRQVLSSSPETFLKMSHREIQTRPIKGTRPRRDDPEADQQSAQQLLDSQKERAELVMITDLQRNDLGQVCEFGSVQVTDLLALEKLEHVYHLVSTITGTLREDTDHIAALQACFPGGSITGAPKKRAMEIIAELETVPRGLYTGAIGYIGFNHQSQFNIPIRTLVHENNTLHYHVGAGIVADSNPAEEYQETLDKAKGIKLAIEQLQAEKR